MRITRGMGDCLDGVGEGRSEVVPKFLPWATM